MLIFTPVKQRYFYEIDSSQLPELISEVIYNHACQSDCLVDYCDGDFKYPTTYNSLKELLKPLSEEWDEEEAECEDEEGNPYKEFLEDFPIEITSNPDMFFLIEYCQ